MNILSSSQTKGLGHTESASSLTIELEEITSETIDNSLIFGGDLKMVAQILSTISQFLNSHQKENFDEKELKVNNCKLNLDSSA